MKLTIDPVTGLAGDMFIAALISAGAPQKETEEVMNFAGNLIGKASIQAQSVKKADCAGIRLNCQYRPDKAGVESDVIAELLARVINEYLIGEDYCEYAELALDVLCQAEGRAHHAMHQPDTAELEKTLDAHQGEIVHLHEAQDILVDIAGSAFALMKLGVSMDTIGCFSPIRFGGGTVTFSHGTHPVPAPATKQIIEAWDIPMEAGPVDMELFTPTGAALIAALSPRFINRNSLNIDFAARGTIGMGFGTLDFSTSGEINALRVYLSK